MKLEIYRDDNLILTRSAPCEVLIHPERKEVYLKNTRGFVTDKFVYVNHNHKEIKNSEGYLEGIYTIHVGQKLDFDGKNPFAKKQIGGVDA